MTDEIYTHLSRIAMEEFNIHVLETRKRDSLDFYDVAIWNIKAALTRAFLAGTTYDASEVGSTVKVAFTCKPTDLSAILANVETITVSEVIHLTQKQYDRFANKMHVNYTWLQGKGGYDFKLGMNKAIKVTALHRKPLYVNPEGYSNARYTGVKVDY